MLKDNFGNFKIFTNEDIELIAENYIEKFDKDFVNYWKFLNDVSLINIPYKGSTS